MSYVTWVKARIVWPKLLQDVATVVARIEELAAENALLRSRIEALERATSTVGLPKL